MICHIEFKSGRTNFIKHAKKPAKYELQVIGPSMATCKQNRIKL